MAKGQYKTLVWIALGAGAVWWFARMRQSADARASSEYYRASLKPQTPPAGAPTTPAAKVKSFYAPVMPMPPAVLAYLNNPSWTLGPERTPHSPPKIKSVIVVNHPPNTHWNYYTQAGGKAHVTFRRDKDMADGGYVMGVQPYWMVPDQTHPLGAVPEGSVSV